MLRAKRLSGSLRGQTYWTLVGLLACTGLRISEAIHLKTHDVDLEEGVLTVRESKYRNTRLVPLHATALRHLQHYAGLRRRMFPLATSFFASERGTPLAYRTVAATFSRLRSGMARGRRRPPRLHDLRHTFACRVLLRWQKNPKGASSRVAILSRYLGHAHVTDTYWYLSALPELMAQAGEAFARYRDEK
jgi:integrase